jgi:hypothetical protein
MTREGYEELIVIVPVEGNVFSHTPDERLNGWTITALSLVL